MLSSCVCILFQKKSALLLGQSALRGVAVLKRDSDQSRAEQPDDQCALSTASSCRMLWKGRDFFVFQKGCKHVHQTDHLLWPQQKEVWWFGLHLLSQSSILLSCSQFPLNTIIQQNWKTCCWKWSQKHRVNASLQSEVYLTGGLSLLTHGVIYI